MTLSTNQEILKLALAESGKRQVDLAEELHVNQATISTNMRRDRMGMDVFVRLLNAMGYSVVVGKETEDGFEAKWTVSAKC